MPYSMTGYGYGESFYGTSSIKCEMKSINYRFVDIYIKIPRKLNVYEEKIKELLRKKLLRGRIDVTITVSGEEDFLPSIIINKNNAKYYYDLLKKLKEFLGLEGQISLDNMLNFSDIFDAPESEKINEDFSRELMKAVDVASDRLMESRKQEGRNLIEDFSPRLAYLNECIGNIENIAENRAENEYNNLKEKVNSIIENKYNNVDENRLEMELAIIAERLDISEECTRFKSHLNLFREEIKKDKPIGRKLDFIIQEMNREVNTITSKSSNFKISKYVIEIKDELEKLREQSKNLV